MLREGEKFLAKYPTSMFLQIICAEMNNAINHKHAVADGKQAAVEAIAKLPPAERDNPCKRAHIYNEKAKLADAKREYIACDKKGLPPYWATGAHGAHPGASRARHQRRRAHEVVAGAAGEGGSEDVSPDRAVLGDAVGDE